MQPRFSLHLTPQPAWRRSLLAVVTGLVSTGLTAQTAAPEPKPAPPPTQRLLESQPATGTSIRREMVRSTVLPINLRYDQLSDAQRAEVHSWYGGLAPGDEPPYPADSPSRLYRQVAQVQAKLLVAGALEVHVTVDANGEVSQVRTFKTPTPQMAEVVGQLLFATPFKPARCGGQPCRMDFPFWFAFETR